LAAFCLLSCSTISKVEASDVDIDCPGKDEAFVTTCSGSESNNEAAGEADSFDDIDLVDEVLQESKKSDSYSQKEPIVDVPGAKSNAGQKKIFDSEEADSDDSTTESSAAMHQLKETTEKLLHQYYEPLPKQGKCVIGTICGFTASRLSLGVANRIFRLAGATWVLSELLHTSGFCDNAKCVPEEARPWVGIMRDALIKQCVKVRMIARRIWNQDRIREIAQKDELVAGGFAAGAFVGFVV